MILIKNQKVFSFIWNQCINFYQSIWIFPDSSLPFGFSYLMNITNFERFLSKIPYYIGDVSGGWNNPLNRCSLKKFSKTSLLKFKIRRKLRCIQKSQWIHSMWKQKNISVYFINDFFNNLFIILGFIVVQKICTRYYSDRISHD